MRAADDRIARLRALDHAEVAAGKRGGNGDIGIGVGAADPILDAARLRIRHGHTQARGAVVVAPVNVDGRGQVARQAPVGIHVRSEEHTSELQSPCNLVCRLLLEKKIQIISLSEGNAELSTNLSVRVVGTKVHRLVNTQTDRLRTLTTTQLLIAPQNRTAI